MVIAGKENDDSFFANVEVIDVGLETRCQDLPPYPFSHAAAVAEYYEGKIVVCGGLTNDESE